MYRPTGYTQYLYRPEVIDQGRFDLWVEDCKAIIAALPTHTRTAGAYHEEDVLKLAWEYDEPTRPPQLDGDCVRFNGASDDPEADLGHETFRVPRVFDSDYKQPNERGLMFDCCKTARKPYDLAVVACLTALKYRVPEVELSSDGDLEERAEGIALAEQVLIQRCPVEVIAGKLEGVVWDCDHAGYAER